MSRRKDNSPAISFFSFQDIITSVTGIMFLVVLILILMLVMRQNYTAEQREEIHQLDALKAELQRLQEQMSAASQASQAIEKRLKELEALNIQDVPQQIRKLGGELAALELENRQASEKQLEKAALLESLKTRLDELRQLLRMGGEKAKAQGEEEKLLTAQIAELERKIQSSQKTMRFTWQKSTSKKPLLVECGGESIAVGVAQNDVPLARFSGKDSSKLVGKFMSWVKNYDRDSHYLLLLVKPGAFEYAESLSQMLQTAGYERGREVLPADDVAIFQEASK